VLALVFAGLYVGAFYPAYAWVGPHATHLATLPVLAAALLMGMRGGVLAAVGSVALSLSLLPSAGAEWRDFFEPDVAPIHFALLILTALMGREVDLGRRVVEEQDKREEAERVLARNRALVVALPDQILRFGADGTWVDTKWDEGKDERRATSPRTIDTHSVEEIRKHVPEVIAKGEGCTVEYTVEIDDEVHELEARLAPVRGDEVLAVVRDLTELKRLQQEAVRDGMTGLFNRRYFAEAVEHELRRASRHGHPTSIVFVDVDHFKTYNDTHGHPAGDAVLKQVARILGNTGQFEEVPVRGRSTDIVSRYGGEEFVLILPETDADGARIRADRIRQCLEEFPFEHRESQPLGAITASFGIAAYPRDGETAEDVLERADQAVYAAKHGGRNRIELARDHPAAGAEDDESSDANDEDERRSATG
jgi:diguanylate cyclase (GGDEF)-like protein